MSDEEFNTLIKQVYTALDDAQRKVVFALEKEGVTNRGMALHNVHRVLTDAWCNLYYVLNEKKNE